MKQKWNKMYKLVVILLVLSTLFGCTGPMPESAVQPAAVQIAPTQEPKTVEPPQANNSTGTIVTIIEQSQIPPIPTPTASGTPTAVELYQKFEGGEMWSFDGTIDLNDVLAAGGLFCVTAGDLAPGDEIVALVILGGVIVLYVVSVTPQVIRQLRYINLSSLISETEGVKDMSTIVMSFTETQTAELTLGRPGRSSGTIAPEGKMILVGWNILSVGNMCSLYMKVGMPKKDWLKIPINSKENRIQDFEHKVDLNRQCNILDIAKFILELGQQALKAGVSAEFVKELYRTVWPIIVSDMALPSVDDFLLQLIGW